MARTKTTTAAVPNQIKADLSLLLVTIGWGASFILTKNALAHLATFNFLAIRFFIAFAFSSVVFWKQMLKIDKETIKWGIIVGAVLFSTYAFQTVGLNYTTASKSAFITGFSVVLVPVFSTLIMKNKLESKAYVSVAAAFIGLGLLTVNQSISNINIGDVLTFGCAILAAVHIILAGKFTVKVESITFAIVQIGTIGFLSLITSFIFEKPTLTDNAGAWASIITLSLVCTSGAFITQMVAQKFTSPTHTALIFSGEPVFAGIFGYLIFHEVLGIKGVAGGALVLMGMLMSELDFKQLFRKKSIMENMSISPDVDVDNN